MEKHTLFMLNPWMDADGQGPYYCPGCGVVEGFFAYSMEVKAAIDIVHVDFKRPRKEVVEKLGLENQECPVLVLGRDVEPPENAKKSFSTGRYFIDEPVGICNFLGKIFEGILPHP
ncbi:DUF3088 family protein [Desulfocicer niacini]